MSDITDCPEHRGEDTVERWVTQTLPDPDAERFEVHLLECERCQEAVRTATTVRAKLRQRVEPPARRTALRLVVPLGLAAAVAVLLLLREQDPLARLSDPGPAPEFTPLPVRAAQVSPSAGDLGMQAYAAGDYGLAARLLDSAAVVDPTPATRFFHGVSLLKSGKALEATGSLGAVVRDSVNPYASDAALWLAKAWLRARLPDSAEVVLRSLGSRSVDAGIAAHSRALSDSIRGLRRR